MSEFPNIVSKVWIARLCFVLPIVCVHLTWLVGTLYGNLEPCITYWANCHSISATGRQVPEFYLFKTIMLPVAIVMAVYWNHVGEWAGEHSGKHRMLLYIKVIGWIGCTALILYTLTLGVAGESSRLLRRTGIVFFFVMTSFAHLLLLYHLESSVSFVSVNPRVEKLLRCFKWVCGLMVVAGLVSGGLGFMWENWDAWENAFEWWFSLLMMSLFLILSELFRCHSPKFTK